MISMMGFMIAILVAFVVGLLTPAFVILYLVVTANIE